MTPTTTARAPLLLSWQEYRRSLRWVEGAAWGSHWGIYRTVKADHFDTRFVVVPHGQSIPAQDDNVDTIMVGVQGELEFEANSTRYLLQPFDVLRFDRPTMYRFTNVGFTTGLFVQFLAKNPTGGVGAAANSVDGATREPIHMRWDDYRRRSHWELPLADTPGKRRGSFPHVRTATLRGHMVRQPEGESCPWHAAFRDVIFIQMQGETEFNAAGRVWPLSPRDILLLPPETPYVYTNVGDREALFFDMALYPPVKRTVYYQSDPGWPIDPRAPTFETELGSHETAQLVRKNP